MTAFNLGGSFGAGDLYQTNTPAEAVDLLGLSELSGPVESIADLRTKTTTTLSASSVTLTTLLYRGDGGGRFAVSTLDTTTPDDGRQCIVDASGRRWRRSNYIEPLKQRFSARSGAEIGVSQVGLSQVMTRASNQSVASGTASLIIWDTTLESQLTGVYSGGSPSVLTIPDYMAGCVVELTASVPWAAAATGVRTIEFWRNGATFNSGGRSSISSAGATGQTVQSIRSRPLRVFAGDQFSVMAYQDSGAALDITNGAGLSFSLTILRDSWLTRNPNGGVYQGAYETMATSAEVFGSQIAQLSVVILSHPPFLVNDTIFPTPTMPMGCLDGIYPFWAEAIRHARAINPTLKIFGYVSGAADAPAGFTCGYTHPPGTPWAAPGVPNATAWITKWAELPDSIRPDGIFFDLIADKTNGGWITPTVRDDLYAAARARGFLISPNTVNASFINVAFAAEGLGRGDVLAVEGFNIAAGTSVATSTDAAMIEAARHLGKGVLVYALASSAWGVVPTGAQIAAAKAQFEVYAQNGYTFSVQSADLGLVNPIIPLPIYGVQR